MQTNPVTASMTTPSMPAPNPNNVIATLLDPFRGINIAGTYAEHASFIDFAIYVLLFTAVAHATLHKRFPGRSGKVISFTVGLMLAIAMAVAEETFNFNLASFGPIAAGIVLFLAAAVLFTVIRHMGGSTAIATAVAFIMAYFTARAVAPEHFDQLLQNSRLAWINSFFLFLMALVVVTALAGLLHRQPGPRSLRYKARQLRSLPQRIFATGQREDAERRLFKRGMKRTTNKEIHESKRTVGDLEDINIVLRKKGTAPDAMNAIGRKLRRISTREAQMLDQLKDLRQLTDQAENFDIQAYQELRKESRDNPKPPKDEIDMEWTKIRVEEKLKRFEQGIWKYDADFRYAINKAIEALRKNDARAAMSWIATAIRHEQEARDTFRRMKHLEKKLIHLTARETMLLPAGRAD